LPTSLAHRSFFFFFTLLVLFSPPVVATAEAAEAVQMTVKGVEGDEADNVRAALVLPTGLVRDGLVDLRWLERFADRAPQLVRKALRPFGYYNAQATVSLQELVPERRYNLIVQVEQGKPVRVAEAGILIQGPGSDESELRELTADFPLKRGDVLRQDLYEEAKGALKARAIDFGYLNAAFSEHRILVDPEENSAEIDLVLATGPRFQLGETLIHGAPEFPDKFLRRYMAYEADDPFSYARLGQTQLNFLDSDRFRDVIVTPRLEMAQERRVPVSIQLVPSARRRLRPGIGYGTDTGARFSLEYKDVNMLHRGHEFSADFLVAELRQDLVAGYIVPSPRNMNTQTALRAGLEREQPDTYERSTLFVELERVRGFKKGITGSVFLRLLQEDYTVGEEADDTSFLVLPGVRFSRRSYSDPVRPRQGYLISLEVRGTHQDIGSDTGLLQAIGSGNILVPLPARFSVFARVKAGSTWQNEPLRELPPSLRFFAGGDQSVRGYGYQDLGPRDENGDVIGGKNLLVGSVELERALGENWGVAVFYDAGNAFDNFSDYEIFEGAGIGVRRYTPIGPVRIDFARQLGVQDPSTRLHIGVGFGW
jgi:translocation and assembly module TamA